MPLLTAGLSLAVFLGRYSYSRARPALAEHSHGAAFEICYLVKGQQTYCVGERNYHLRGGDVFITFPHERHGTGSAPEEKGVLYWLVVRVPERTARTTDALVPLSDALGHALR